MLAPSPKVFGWVAPDEEPTNATSVTPHSPLFTDHAELDRAIDELRGLCAPTKVPATNNRRAWRNRVLLGGKIVFGAGDRSMDCTICDLTEDGARVRLGGAEPVPSRLYLIEMRRGLAFEAEVAWVCGRELGVAFRQTHSLDGVCPPALMGLRRLWIERLPR